MSRKKKKDKDSYIPPAPQPANSYIYDGNTLRSASIYDPATNAYINRVYSSPAEDQTRFALQQQYNTLLSQVGKSSPEQVQSLNDYEQTIYQKARQPLDEAFQQGNRQARESFNATGFINSTGFEDYRSRQLNKIYQEGLSQAAIDARLAREQLAADYQKQLLQKLNAIAGSLSGNTSANLDLQGSAQTSAANLNQFASQNYLNQLQQLSLKRNNESRNNFPPFYQRLLFSYLGNS